jgi:hypothetical protein
MEQPGFLFIHPQPLLLFSMTLEFFEMFCSTAMRGSVGLCGVIWEMKIQSISTFVLGTRDALSKGR